jgi:polyisoprenoid-binding protein YceI
MSQAPARHVPTLLSVLALAGCLTSAAQASPDPVVYRVNPTLSTVEFSLSKWTVTRQVGLFRALEGTIALPPDRPEGAAVDIRVDAASLDTRNETRDDVVRSEDFLHVSAHRFIRFRSTSVRRNGSGSFDVTGDLTLRGVTRRIVAPVRFLGITRADGLGELAAFETSFVIDRRDFGVLGSRWSGGRAILGDEVTVHLAITALRAD